VVGRDTGSSAKNYLIWEIRQAQKGRIPIGPRRTRRADGEAPDFKVLPLRMEAELVTQLDEARERLGLKSFPTNSGPSRRAEAPRCQGAS